MASKSIERVFFVFLVVFPFVFFSNSIDPVLIPRQLYLSVFLIVTPFILYFKNSNLNYLPLKSPIIISIFCYFTFTLCAFISSDFTSESHYILSKQLLLFSFLLLVTILLYNKLVSINTIIKSCIAFGMIAISSASIQILKKTIEGQGLFRQIESIDGLFANKNLLASILFLCLPFFFMGLQLSKKIKLISGFGLFFTLFIIVIIRTRVVLIASILFFLILLYSYLRIQFKIKRRYFLALGVAFVSAGVLIYKNYLEKSIQNLKSSRNTAEQYFFRVFDSETFKSRTQFWENSWAMFKEHPLFGVGVGNWQVYFPKYGLGKFQQFDIANGISTLQRPHNDFIAILCENGIIGFLGYAVIFGIIYYQLTKLITKAENKIEKWNFIFIFAAITGYCVISFFDFPLERIEHQVLLMLLFAVTIASYYSRFSSTTETKTKNKILLYLVVIIAVYSFVVSSFRFNGELESVKMYTAKSKSQWDETLFRANKATSYFYKIDPTSMPIDWYRGIACFNRNEIDESETYFESAYKMAPYQVQVINNLGTCYQVKGEKRKAEELYQKALQISPNFEEAQLNLAAIFYNDKEFEKAFQMIDKMDVNSKNTRYKMFLVRILEKKINQVLTKAPVDLATKVAANITTSDKITQLYFDSKKNKTDFEYYILHSQLGF